MTAATPAHRTHAIHHDPSAAQTMLELEREDRRRQQETQRRRNVRLHVAGRVLFSVVFIASGAAKLFSWDATVAALQGAGAWGVASFLPLVVVIELVGGALIASGLKTREVSLGLVVYLAAVTLLMHHDLSLALNRAFLVTNIALAGGLVLLMAHGSGAFSLDTHLARWRARRHGQ